MNRKCLQQYIQENIVCTKGHFYHNESFCNLVLDYYSMYGEFSNQDKLYLFQQGYDYINFLPEEEI